MNRWKLHLLCRIKVCSLDLSIDNDPIKAILERINVSIVHPDRQLKKNQTDNFSGVY